MKITRRQYADLYGPTRRDKIRLGDTSLWIEIEEDLTGKGDELVFGAPKTLRAGAGANVDTLSRCGALDIVITNAIIVDPILGVIKADIGIKNGRIAGIGKAGDPNIMDGVAPDLIVGPSTDVRAAEGLIATAGGIDCHVHFIDPGQCGEALSSGITTLIGGGLGATTVPIASTGVQNLAIMLRAAEDFPLNFGFFGKGGSYTVEPLAEQLRSGAGGLKIHEDWGAMPPVINACLEAGDEFDVQIQLHADTLNEAGYLQSTMEAIAGRTIHAYHVEGAAGGHAPDILEICGYENVLPSSTNPTNPYTINTFDEHFDMTMTSHHLNPRVPEDIAFAESRIRHETIAAEDVLHDMGAISAMGSDSQGMGRIAETICRTWQLASHMKSQRGALDEDRPNGNDNQRVLRYIAKYTINPAIIFGIAGEVGSLEVGKMADIVLWKPKFFGIHPEIVFKGGFPVWAVMGEPSASLMTCAPLQYRPQWGAFGHGNAELSATFMAKVAIDDGIPEKLGLSKKCLPLRGARQLSKRDMIRNSTLPKVRVDPETYRVTIDDIECVHKPMTKVPLGRLYSLR
ncbi:urease, alpha subunit [Roseovarius mucosus DSM 17069]|uniref:Urease subunit alpha n=1 Tax=Roseovarius mucosus DSM 17069 TaxID=1288298 RepID=A0A0A0HHR2_9RHOB|nr:urease subunit alpha [Roseovarius mucosus]KGM86491.1 urease, alpha subunit [Roseovarius mucosus DSM 17069]